jgi:hypothetical protein
MTLFEKLQQLIDFGYEVNFKREINQLLISVEREDVIGNIFIRESCLPLSDHFYESRVVDCIDYMVNEINEKLALTN